MKLNLAVAGCLVALVGSRPALADPSPAGTKLMALTTIVLGVNLCDVKLSPPVLAKLNQAVTAAGNNQKDFTQAQYGQLTQTIGAEMAKSKAEVCAGYAGQDNDEQVSDMIEGVNAM